MSEIRRRLERLHAEETRKITQQFVDDLEADLGKPLGRLDTIQRLLGHQPNEGLSIRVPILIGFLCVFLVGLTWALRIPQTQIVIHVQTQSATLELAERWNWSGHVAIVSNPVYMEGWDSIDAPMLDFGKESALGDVWLNIEGGNLKFVSYELQSQGFLSILQRSNGQVDILAQGQPVEAQLALMGPAHVRVGANSDELVGKRKIGSRAPEMLVLSSDGIGAVPTHLRILPDSDWRLHNLKVIALSFARQTPAHPGEVVFESALLSGRIKVLATGDVQEIDTAERLYLQGVTGRTTVTNVNNKIELRFEGSAKDIFLGPDGFAQDLSPTLLEFLYHQQPLSFFWSAVVFLWGLIWSVHRILIDTG